MIITNARVFDGRKFIMENSLEEKNGIITDIFFAGKEKIKGDVFNAAGKILAPGLIDIHTHGGSGINSLEIRGKKNLAAISVAIASGGTTSALIAGFYSHGSGGSQQVISGFSSGMTGARILGLYLEGPFINPEKRGMIPAEFTDTGEHMQEILKDLRMYYKHLRIMTIAPELKCAGEVLKKLAGKGVILALGHSRANYKTSLSSFRKGITHVTHLFNAMEGVHHRQPGPLGALMDSATTTAEIIADGNHIHPSVLKMAYRLLGRDRLILITDSTGMGSLKNGNYHFGAIGDFTVRNGSSYFPDGRLIGTNIPLISMCANMKKWAGATFEETAQMATFNPARLLGEKLGEIRIGYPADLILTDEKFSLYGVWIGGKKI